MNDASRSLGNGERAARLSDRSLRYALEAGETIELEKARSDIERFKNPRPVSFGCESRQYIWARSEEFVKRFTEVMNFATVTHYVWDSWYELFEPREGVYNWGIKDNIVSWLAEHNIAIQGRPLFWFHPTVTPDWLKNKSFDELKRYIDKHTYDLVTHYGDKVLQWEVFNEYHDWANIHNHTPDQITALTRQALDRTKEINPKVVRILNNCCPWAEYAARGRMARMDASRPLRSPRRFLSDLASAIFRKLCAFWSDSPSSASRSISPKSEPAQTSLPKAQAGPSPQRPGSRIRGIATGTRSCRPIGWSKSTRSTTASHSLRRSTGMISRTFGLSSPTEDWCGKTAVPSNHSIA